MLSQKNKHERDDRITFDEPTHTYCVDGSSDGIISTTSLIHEHFPKFDANKIVKFMKNKKEKYPNMTDEQIKESWNENGKKASCLGTKMHKMIENFYNGLPVDTPETIEFQYFLSFHDTIKDTLDPYRTEWSIFDGIIGLAGQIDMIYKKKDGTYAIYDWKRVKDIKKDNLYEKGIGKLDNCNYNHYSLQLNVYKRLLETRYDIKISEMMLVILHPDNKTFLLEEVKDMSIYIDMIFKKRLEE